MKLLKFTFLSAVVVFIFSAYTLKGNGLKVASHSVHVVSGCEGHSLMNLNHHKTNESFCNQQCDFTSYSLFFNLEESTLVNIFASYALFNTSFLSYKPPFIVKPPAFV